MEHFHNNTSVTSSSVTTEELNTARRLITRRIDEHKLSVGISLALSVYTDTHFICHGNSDPLVSKPTTPDTIYEIGSVSKVVTGLLLSLLSLEGLVSLDTPVRDVLPAGLIFPDTELATATLFDLASHYSGLPSVPPSILSASLQNPYRDFDVSAMKDYLKSSQTVTPPGTRFEYSNTGFTLLGIILEHITGEDYINLVRQRIFRPLGMTDTWADLPKSEEHRFSQGFDINGETTVPWDTGIYFPAGGWRSTVRDLSRFILAASGQPSSPLTDAFTLMLDRTRATDDPDTQIGLGWFITDNNLIWHNGMTGGFSSMIGFRRDTGRGVVALSNQSSVAGVDDIGLYLLDHNNPLFPPPPATRDHNVSPLILRMYEGEYHSETNDKFRVFIQNERLYLCPEGQGRIWFRALSDDTFTSPGAGADIRFRTEKKGSIVQLELSQDGECLTAVKVNKNQS